MDENTLENIESVQSDHSDALESIERKNDEILDKLDNIDSSVNDVSGEVRTISDGQESESENETDSSDETQVIYTVSLSDDQYEYITTQISDINEQIVLNNTLVCGFYFMIGILVGVTVFRVFFDRLRA